MRRSSRRRPAGNSRVPVNPTVLVSSRPDELLVWRLGPQRQVWDLSAPVITTVASIWLTGEPAAWRRAVWPHDQGVPIAPLDLSAGHTLELCNHDQAAVTICYACVIDIAYDAIVAFTTPACDRALLAGDCVASAWLDANVNDARERLRRPR